MALGDTGISPLEHTGAYATFANHGRLAKPYAILEVFNSKGELVYSRERDEPPAPQIIDPRAAEQMNQMMQLVVTEGTGRRAALDFTHAVGKTGTSSSYRDAWFVGFTGRYVGGVWIGNDDFRPMRNVTGGSLPAAAWQTFMAVAHTNMNIPTIPGLPPHPAQVAEQQRLADLRRIDPRLAKAQEANQQGRSSNLMPDATKDALRRLAAALRKANGMEPAVDEPNEPARRGPQSPGGLPERRADALPAGNIGRSGEDTGRRTP